MHFLDLSLPVPTENLACDEALLDACADGTIGETLRCWESPGRFIAVGYANRIATEVHLSACRAKQIPVLRRCTGGGTVVQGPGCLNYSLVLKIADDGPLRTITSANRFIMERNRSAIEPLLNSKLKTQNSKLSVEGHTDLALAGRKCSGNAQRRRKHCLLFHGTFLLGFDLARISELLPLPSKQPSYRASRSHADFLINLDLSADAVKAALRRAWNAVAPLETIPSQAIESLARDKYVTDEWNLKF